MRKYLSIAIFVLFTIQSHADSYYGKRISINNGLSQASVTCIEYSSNGSLWIGTRFGLNEYSNGKIRSFLGNRAAGLEGGYINGLYNDKYSKLWVMTDKGVFLYDDSSDAFTPISQEVATCIFERSDTLYIGGNSGISRYSRIDGSFTKGSADGWTDILKIYEYGGKLLSIDRRLGIQLIDGSGAESLDIKEIKESTIMSSSLHEDTLILSILGKGVLFYDLSKRSTKHFIRNGEHGLSRDLILCSEIINGKLWLGTDGGGVEIMDMETGTVSDFYKSISLNPNTEVPKSVTTIYPDPLGNIWLGGVHFGVTGLKATAISSFLPNEIVNCFHSSADGKLYIGTDGKGLYSYSDGTLTPIRSTVEMKITSIADYDDNNLIICAYTSGFHLVDRRTGYMRPLIIIDRKTNEAECLYGNAPEICPLDDGRMILFAVNNYVHNSHDGSFMMLNDQTEGDAKDLRVIHGEGHATYTYTKTGIYRINLGEMRLERIHDARQSGEDAINAVIVTGNNLLYGTDYGLFSLSLETGIIENIRKDLITKVTELCSDDNGTVWIGADNALFAYRDGSLELLGEDKGVAANEFTASAIKDGIVYIGGTQGFLEIHPASTDSMVIPVTNKQFSLHNISLSGKTIKAEDGNLSVPYKYDNLAISVSLLGADPLERLIYRYSIEGPSSFAFDVLDNTIQIPSLKSGSYEVKVSYPMEMGIWSVPQTILKLKVKTPWYSSLWMIIIYILILVGSIDIFIYLMKKKMMKELAEQLRNRDILFVNKFEKYIDEHLGENELNVEQIAADMAMSRATLYTKVKNAYSLGIGEYIEQKRMEKAREMLENGNDSVADIAEAIGYSTPRYFSMRFKKATGETPHSYRKKHKSR